MRPDDAKQASQPVQRLEHRRDERGVAAVAWENLANRGFNPADQFLGFLPLLIGHVRFPSASDGRRFQLGFDDSHSTRRYQISAAEHLRQAEPRSEERSRRGAVSNTRPPSSASR
jgi:hypothetical protein